MKQFLRHIFLLVALFVAAANAWAECYVLNESQIKAPYEKNNSNESGTYSPEYSIDGPCAIMTFSYRLNADVNATYWHRFFIQGLNNSGQWIDLFDSDKIYNAGSSSTITKDISAYANQISKLRVKRTAKKGVTSWDAGTKDVLVNNIKITRLTSISPESASHTFDPITVGESTPTHDFTFNYSNVGTNFVVSSKNSSPHFSISYISPAAPDACVGSATYRVTYNPQFGGSHDEIYTITCKDGNTLKGTVTISVAGSAKGYPQHTWYGKDIYKVDDAAIDLDEVWDSKNDESNTITYSIEANGFTPSGKNNEGAVKPYIDADNKLYLGQAGTLHLVMHQIATDGFYEKTSTKTITINKYDVEASISQSTAVWNEIIDNPFSLSYGLIDFDVESKNTNIAEYHKDTKKIQTYFTDGTAYFQITRPEDYKYKELDKTFSIEVKAAGGCNVLATEKDKEYAVGYYADPKEYWFDLEGVGDVLTVELKKQDNSYGYIHIVGYDENGGNETNLGSFKHSEISTDWGDVKTCTIPKNEIRKIQIKSGGDIAADALHKYFRNLKVTRKTSLDPQVDDKLYLSQSSTDMTYIGIFNLNWSTCADEIRLACDNPMFVVTPSVIKASGEGFTQILVTANAQNAANLTGNLTVYDQTQKETIILSCEQLLQRIEWNQYFGNLESTEEGYINETFELNAVAKTVTGNLTNQPITYNLNSISPAGNASLSTENGKTYLHITGKCEGTITASVEGFTKDGKTYSSDAITHDIRVRKAGEPCNTVYSLKDRIELNTIETSEPIYVGDKNPDTLRFIAHRDITAANYFYVVYSTNGGSAWADLDNPMLPEETDTQYEYTLPDNTTHVRFETRTGATWKKYVKNIEVTQKSYLNVDPSSISETIYVNTPFSKEITVQYSDIPLIQSELTKNTTDNLYLYPHQSVNNNCGQYGEYTFTLLGEWEEPQTIQETIRFFTSAGDEKLINIKIDVITNTQITSQADGDWNNPSSWFPNIIPTASHPVIIKHAIEVSSPAEAYGVVMTQEAHINIASTGGLTVHAGGYTPLNKNEEDLEITIDNDHAGYFRMSPEANTATMPKAIVNFTTKGTLNGGGNDAAYQYIGAPGEGAATDILGTTVLYLRSEEKGWVRLKTFWAELEAFAGYALTQKAQREFTFYPQLINGDKIIQLTYTPDGMKGDNLWANSYMAPLDITKFTPDDFTGNVTRTFYLYNSGSYDQWKKDTSSVSTAGEVPGRYYAIPVLAARALGPEAQTVVPPMQGVYMKAGEGGGEIILSYEKHVWNNTQTAQMNKPLRIAGRNESAEKQNPDFQRVRLQVTSENSGADRMYIIQDSLTTSGYDNGYDAPKQMADNLMNIYTNEPFGKMEISSTNNMDGMYIGFKAGDDSEYTMTFSSLIGDSLYLYDMEADEYIEMTENGQYQFSATPMSTNDLRFQLLVAPDLPDNAPEQGGDVATMIENLSTTKLWISDKMVYVTNVQPNSTLAIYGLGGICVAQYQIPEGMKNVQYPISNLPVGVYIIRLNDQACKFVCK